MLSRGTLLGDLTSQGFIEHATWRDGRWSSPVPISRFSTEMRPSLGPAPGGAMVALWGEVQVKDINWVEAKSFASIWKAECNR